MVKRILKGLGVLILVGLVGVAAFIASDWRYFQRIATFDRNAAITDVDFYAPLVEVAPGSPPPLVRATPDTRTLPANTLAEVEAMAKETGSVALLIWHRGELQYEYYEEGAEVLTLTNSASMHKSVSAILVGIAIDEGLIESVDDPVAKYVEEWSADARRDITIRHVLQMSSGLDRPQFSFNPLSDNLKLSLGTDIESLILKYGVADPPGTVFAYSNLNSQVLGILLERATGIPYAEFLETRLWKKVAAHPANVWLDRPGGMPRTFTGLFATAEDWLRLGLLHLNKGRVGETQVVSETWMDAIATPSPTNPQYGFQTWLGTVWTEDRDYGKGVAARVRHTEPFVSPDVVYFDGSGGQRVYIMAEDELVIVRTGRGGLDFRTGYFNWEESSLPNLVTRAVRRAAASEPSGLEDRVP